MSLSLTDELQVVLGPAQVTLARVGRELTLRGIARPLRESCSVDCLPAAGGAPRWRAALDALETALPSVSRPIGPVTVLLSNHFVRYVVVPWSDALANAAEDAAFARHCFSDLYGDLADQWELRLSPGRVGAPRLASAADRDLLDALRETFGRAQLPLRSIQPHLMAACNGARRRLHRRSVWVALPETDALCVALLRKGEWVSIRSLRVGPLWQRELRLLLQRERLMAEGETPRQVALLAPNFGPAGLALDAEGQVPGVGAWYDSVTPARRRHGARGRGGWLTAMRSLRLDYQQRTRVIPWLGTSLLLLALLLLALVSLQYHQLSQQIASLDATLALAQRQASRGSSARTAGERDATALAPEIGLANDALRHLARPWQTLFEAVEASTGSEEVALLSMEPDVQKGTVKIGAEARNEKAMLGYVRRLMAKPVFGDVHLQSHQVQQQDAQRPVRFSVLAAWKSAQ